MTFVVKKYGRWNESCNWQLESMNEKVVDEKTFKQFKEYAGFTYSERYNEFHAISEDKLRMTVVTVAE